MKKILIALLLMLALAFCLVACNGNDTPDTPDNGDVGDTPGGDGNTDEPTPGDGIDWENTGLDGLALIYNGKARFQVVYTAESGATALRIANAFVERLRELNTKRGTDKQQFDLYDTLHRAEKTEYDSVIAQINVNKNLIEGFESDTKRLADEDIKNK